MDGIHGLTPFEKMDKPARRVRTTYAITPGAPLRQIEFGFYCLDRWKEQGLDVDTMSERFKYEPNGKHGLSGLGWCEAAFSPYFEDKVIEARGDCEIVQDGAGRHVLCFKGRRSGFMPEYVDHPVKDMMTWERDVLWRLDPSTPERYKDLEVRMGKAKADAAKGMMVCQHLVGGYMYLRSLIGPEALLYKFYDEPELIHACMRAWLSLADAVTAKHQESVTFDEIFLAEDICYNHGPLISPDMIKEFLFPYYQQLIANVKRRQIDKARHLFTQIDTDGFADPVIPLYQEAVGMDVMSPFEVASGCDVVAIGKRFPDLVMSGGIDKRVLAEGKDAIDRHLDRILPAMSRRGGYTPTCDHGVPEEVSLENYEHYRRRVLEYA